LHGKPVIGGDSLLGEVSHDLQGQTDVFGQILLGLPQAGEAGLGSRRGFLRFDAGDEPFVGRLRLRKRLLFECIKLQVTKSPPERLCRMLQEPESMVKPDAASCRGILPRPESP
jgi:hypothetical protein